MKLGAILVPPRPETPRLSAILRPGATLPPIPERVNYLASITDWAVLGNDSAGDCETVRAFNDEHVVTTKLGQPVPYPPDMSLVWQLYRTQNPDFDPNGTADTNGPGSPADGGMQTELLLAYLAEHGMPGSGRKVAGWATVDLRDEHELDAAIAIFGRLWLDVIVAQAQQQQFAQGEPWDYDPRSPEEGGHAILGGGMSPASDESMDAETWAQVVKLTDRFRERQVQTAFVVIWEDELADPAFLEGIDAQAAADAFFALTGKRFPGASEPVAEVPAVAGQPVAPDQAVS